MSAQIVARTFKNGSVEFMCRQLKRITYVEDEPDIRAITDLALTTIGGYELDMYENGQDALDNAAKFKPDLILLDVMLPGMDGPEIMRGFSHDAQMKDKPVIFMTARTQASEVEEYLELGAHAVIKKPFDPVTLPNQIADVWKDLQEVSV
jgi:DNA-binding response OmpR family regulator